MSAAQGDPASGAERTARAAVAWAEAEGWNPGLDDAARFVTADPRAFLTAERDGEIVATVSCALYGETYAFIGFYIVRPGLRGSGIGSALFDRALERAGDRVTGLDGVLAQEQYYERRGFVSQHHNVRWRIAAGGERPGGLVDLASVPFDDILTFDAGVFGAQRERFLRGWIERPPGQALACRRDGTLAGYGIVRECRAGSKIGPLLADDEEVAEMLLRGLLAAAPGGEAFLDMPAANSRGKALRAAREVEPVFETVRMYRNGRPEEDLGRTFGVTTLEFG